MPSSTRQTLLVLSVALAAWAISRSFGPSIAGDLDRAEGEQRSSRKVSQAVSSADYDADYAHFVEQLSAFRAGDDQVGSALSKAAEVLATRHGRADAARVADYYASLDASERRAGLDAFDEFLVFWNEIPEREAETWEEESEVYLERLARFVARVLPSADFVPAGRALALSGRIEVERLEFLESQDDLRLDFLDTAERHLRESIAVFQRAGMTTPQLHPLWLQGRLEILRGRDELARARLQRCAALAKLTRIDDYRERALLSLIQVERNAGDWEAAKEHLRELAKFRRPEDCWELAREQAVLLIQRDEPEKAAEFLIRNRPRESEHLDRWRLVLALARLRQEDLSSARELLDRIARRKEGEDTLLLRATLDLREGDYAAVLDALADLEGPDSVPLSFKGHCQAFILRGEAHLREHRPARALLELQAAKELVNSWEARLERQRSLEDSSASLIGEWYGLHAIVLEATALVQLGQERQAILTIEQAHSASWRKQARQEASSSEVLRVDDLQVWARHYEHGLLTWVSGADSGLAIHLAPDGETTAHEIPFGRRELQRASRRFRQALLNGNAEREALLAQELAEVLLPPQLADSLSQTPSSKGRLLCLAHGETERIPLEALRLGQRLLDDCASLLILPELPARVPGLRVDEGTRWRLLGSPLDELGAERLPASTDELRELEELHPTALASAGAAFDRAALVESIQSGDAVHLATHLLAANRCQSPRFAPVGLELNGGLLFCASEIADLDCDAPLVVLAACETAEGLQVDSRGLQGVARAFLESGARDLLVSLWPIRDQVARRFTPLFHRALLDGLGPAQAANWARARLRDDGVPSADWAAYRVLGRD